MVHARNFRWHVPHAELVAVVDANATSAAAAAAELDLAGRSYGRLAEATAVVDIDAVVVTTPTFTHEALVTDAAARGIHVLCEKPMALTVASCDAMVDACARAHVILQLAFMRRCVGRREPDGQQARQHGPLSGRRRTAGLRGAPAGTPGEPSCPVVVRMAEPGPAS
jgi:hypothetical protein